MIPGDALQELETLPDQSAQTCAPPPVETAAAKYKVLYADPPWSSAPFRAQVPYYPVMALSAIKALPIADYAASDCVLLLWACDPMLREAFEVIDAWGFKFKTVGFYWIKTNT